MVVVTCNIQKRRQHNAPRVARFLSFLFFFKKKQSVARSLDDVAIVSCPRRLAQTRVLVGF